jgi:4-hydroxy-2-oxoheptanedioate aldolase
MEDSMRVVPRVVLALTVALASPAAFADTPKPRLNPIIRLLEQRQPVMGLYAPSKYQDSGMHDVQLPARSPPERARETVDYKLADFIFDGSMEHDFEQSFPTFAAYARALYVEHPLNSLPEPHIDHPMVVKIHEIAPNPELAARRIGQQLDLGVSGITFVGVESAEEVRRGIAAMRYPSQGGTRAKTVGMAPGYWGLTEKEYRRRADVWPLNPDGELINWVIVESRAGLQNVREIAAVKGIGVLWPGAGTLRQVFSTPDAEGREVVDEVAWEAAIQKVLAACKEFNVPCGIPSSPDQIEKRIKQGFSVFLMSWGERGFQTIEIGRKFRNANDAQG